MRVSELAKALKMSSKELLQHLKELRISVKSHASTLDADTVNRIRRGLAVVKQKAVAAAAAKARTAKAAAAIKRSAAKKTAVTRARVTATKATTATARATSKTQADAAAVTATLAVSPPKPAAVAPAPTPPPKPVPPKAKPAPKAKASPPTPTPVPVTPAVPTTPRKLKLTFPLTVKDLAEAMAIKPTDLIKHLVEQGVFVSMVQQLDEATAAKIAPAFKCEILPQPTLEERLQKLVTPDPTKMQPRAPVVTFMGHVDHGKTSLLDVIRQSKVAEKETGGITQHIGAYEVLLENGHVTFLDTPGHEAFSAMRARGANVTDVVVLVVAADDGVMPQTIEAIDHAKAAGVPIVVAINKIDLPNANPDKVKQQLTQYGLIGEGWGGKTIMAPVSAKTRQGIDELLELLLLEAELLELKADPTTVATGVVIEAKKTKDRGPIATVLVQHGTLRIGETIVVGTHVGRVRAMIDDRGHRVKEAGPAKPIEILGLPEVPHAGDQFVVVRDEREAKQLAAQRQERSTRQTLMHPKRIAFEELHQRIQAGTLKELKLVLKTDVRGSLEAIMASLQKLDEEKHDVALKVIHMGVGDISESDVILAAASDAIIIGFHVGIHPEVQVLAVQEGVDVHIYNIIYEIIDTLKGAIEGLLEPKIEETFLSRAEVRKIFQVSKVGMVAGCMVVKGTFRRDATARVIRGGERIYEGRVQNLKRVKDDVREVQEAVECGISLEGTTDLQVGDLIEAWEIKKVARKLG